MGIQQLYLLTLMTINTRFFLCSISKSDEIKEENDMKSEELEEKVEIKVTIGSQKNMKSD